LVGHDFDTSAPGCLKEAWVGSGDAAPAKGVKKGSEEVWRIKGALAEGIPGGADDFGVELVLPENIKGFALGVIIEARETNESGFVWSRRRRDLFDEVLPGTNPHQLAGCRNERRQAATPHV
jgi:hypothetical protein